MMKLYFDWMLVRKTLALLKRSNMSLIIICRVFCLDGIAGIVATNDCFCNISVKAVADHADARPVEAELLLHVVDHQWRRLPHQGRLPARAALDRADHGAVARPLLGVRQVRHRIQIGRDELGAHLVDGQLGRLDLEVVDLAVEAADDGADVLVGLELAACVITLSESPRWRLQRGCRGDGVDGATPTPSPRRRAPRRHRRDAVAATIEDQERHGTPTGPRSARRPRPPRP